eukprot:TRINITY_DN17132_c0_g1_i1.p1 TRINITY_DN17132_c0_g1~~TRINITY_DN17132_c0_g1_i1.p1  ORF type:complete len:373 (-),score=55.19 TRINITY_DN17132_c0_g1_i1:474-1592(-)
MAAAVVCGKLAPTKCLLLEFPPEKFGTTALGFSSRKNTGSGSLSLRLARGNTLHSSAQCEMKLVRQRFPGVGRRYEGKFWRILTSLQDEAPTADVEVPPPDVEEVTDDLDKQTRTSKEAWTQAVDRLAVEVQKLKGVFYEDSADKALAVLRDTTEQMRDHVDNARAALAIEETAGRAVATFRETTDLLIVQAEKAKAALAASAQEAADNSKANLALIAETAPDPIRNIAETVLEAHFVDSGKQESGAKIHDFCLGIPYGGILTVGGVFWFVASGSLSALRFGLFLGGLVLLLSISSLKAWRQGRSSLPYIQAQALVTLIILVREIRRYTATRALFPTASVMIASSAMLGFYAYVYLAGGNPAPKKVQGETDA